MVKEVDYIELGLACADVCEILNQGIGLRRADWLSQPALRAIEKLTL